jgi:hypothetical protein
LAYRRARLSDLPLRRPGSRHSLELIYEFVPGKAEPFRYVLRQSRTSLSGNGVGVADSQPVPCGILTLGMPRRIILWRRATRLGFTCGLKTVRGLGIMAERNAASRAFKFAAGL